MNVLSHRVTVVQCLDKAQSLPAALESLLQQDSLTIV